MKLCVDPARYAVGGRPSIADCALVPTLNVVSAVMPVFAVTDSISRHPKLGAYWEASQQDEINGRVIQKMRGALARAMGR